MENQSDNQLWAVAKKRAAFKKSVAVYFFVNAFLVAIWYFSNRGDTRNHFWPIWPMLGWGLGIAFQYINAYKGTDVFSVEKEYDRLKKDEENKNI